MLPLTDQLAALPNMDAANQGALLQVGNTWFETRSTDAIYMTVVVGAAVTIVSVWAEYE